MKTKEYNNNLGTVKRYYELTKPGIIRGNLLSAVAGFFLASKGDVDLLLLVSVAFGVSFVIASACVFNNYIDRNIDKKMTRTKKRALVTGSISVKNALIYATSLGIIGLLILVLFTNALTALLGVIAFVFYVGIYGYAKRKSPYGTLIGAVPGAMSLVAGYVAVTGEFDTAAAVLFCIMAIWQMPHFYAIAIYRLKDYIAAGLPVLPVVKGVATTKRQIVCYIAVFIVASSLLTVLGYTGYTYLLALLCAGGLWLLFALKNFKTIDSNSWAKKVFANSLVVLLVFSVMISVDSFLP